MAVETLPQLPSTRKSPIRKSGVLTLSGFGIRVCMQNGHLDIEDGVGLVRRNFKLPRVGHGLRRLIVIGSDGFVSLAWRISRVLGGILTALPKRAPRKASSSASTQKLAMLGRFRVTQLGSRSKYTTRKFSRCSRQ